MEENSSSSNEARRFCVYTYVFITTTGSDCQMKSASSISHANNSHGDILAPSKTSPDSSEGRYEQCDFGKGEIIEITGMENYSACNT